MRRRYSLAGGQAGRLSPYSHAMRATSNGGTGFIDSPLDDGSQARGDSRLPLDELDTAPRVR